MGFSDIQFEGYRIDGVAFEAVPSPSYPLKTRMNELQLRDFGLGGGEIHVLPKPDNRNPEDPGVWYAVKCKKEQSFGIFDSENLRIGTIYIKQMGPDQKELRLVALPLEELDNSHLIDRVVGECLKLQAETFGPGPHAQPRAPRPAAPRNR